MKGPTDPLSRLRRALLERGAACWGRLWAWLRTHGRDVALTLLIVSGLVLYLGRPERVAQWAAAGERWGALLHYGGLEESAARFEGEALLRPPADFSASQLAALATFGGALEYLGADTAVTVGADGAAHLWLRTYWRCPDGVDDYRVRYTWGRSGAGMALAAHDLARPAVRSGDYVIDHLLLPETAAAGVVAIQVETGGALLPVHAARLPVEEETRLSIWQR